MKYAKLSELKEGDTVFVDEDFICMGTGKKTVYKDEGGLFIYCDEGEHYLDGQLNEDDELVGVTLHV